MIIGKRKKDGFHPRKISYLTQQHRIQGQGCIRNDQGIGTQANGISIQIRQENKIMILSIYYSLIINFIFEECLSGIAFPFRFLEKYIELNFLSKFFLK